jgi:hypothetical protein
MQYYNIVFPVFSAYIDFALIKYVPYAEMMALNLFINKAVLSCVNEDLHCVILHRSYYTWRHYLCNNCYVHKGNNNITELRTILQRESQNS